MLVPRAGTEARTQEDDVDDDDDGGGGGHLIKTTKCRGQGMWEQAQRMLTEVIKWQNEHWTQEVSTD